MFVLLLLLVLMIAACGGKLAAQREILEIPIDIAEGLPPGSAPASVRREIRFAKETKKFQLFFESVRLTPRSIITLETESAIYTIKSSEHCLELLEDLFFIGNRVTIDLKDEADENLQRSQLVLQGAGALGDFGDDEWDEGSEIINVTLKTLAWTTVDIDQSHLKSWTAELESSGDLVEFSKFKIAFNPTDLPSDCGFWLKTDGRKKIVENARLVNNKVQSGTHILVNIWCRSEGAARKIEKFKESPLLLQLADGYLGRIGEEEAFDRLGVIRSPQLLTLGDPEVWVN